MGRTIRALAKDNESIIDSLSLENIEQSDLDELKNNASELLSKIDELEANNNILKDFIRSLDEFKGLDVDRGVLDAVNENAKELY